MLRTAANRKPIKRNLEDTRSLMSYSHFLIMKAQLSGNFCFDGHTPSLVELQITEQFRRLCEKLSCTLDFCKVSEIPELLDYYDIVYRMGNKCLPDRSFIKSHKQRVFNAWKEGDREISESSVYGMLHSEMKFSPEKVDWNYSVALNSIKGKWIESLKKYGRFPDVTTYENYRRLSYIMRENLDCELGDNSEKSKHTWYELNKIDDLSTVGSLILISYRSFVSSLFPAVLDYEAQMTLDNHILHELSTRSDLPPHDREAFRMALTYNRTLLTD